MLHAAWDKLNKEIHTYKSMHWEQCYHRVGITLFLNITIRMCYLLSSKIVYVYLPKFSTSSRIWHKVNFKWSTTGLYFGVFLQDWLPYEDYTFFTLLFTHSWVVWESNNFFWSSYVTQNLQYLCQCLFTSSSYK